MNVTLQLEERGKIKTYAAYSKTCDASEVLPRSMKWVYRPPLHSSSVKEGLLCPRKFYWRDRLGLRRIGQFTRYFERGVTFHIILENILKGLSFPRAVQAAWAKTSIPILQEGRIQLNKLGTLPNGDTWEEFHEKITQTFRRSAAMAHAVWMHKPIPQGKYTPVEIEREIIFRIGGIPAQFSVKPDTLLEGEDGLWILDYKTTSRPPREVLYGWTFDLQPSLYRWGVTAKYPRMAIKGIIHYICQVPGIRYSPKRLDKERGFPGYLERVGNWYVDRVRDAEEGLPGSLRRLNSPILQSKIEFPADKNVSTETQRLLLTGAHLRNQRCKIENYPRCCNAYICSPVVGESCVFRKLCQEEGSRQRARIIELEFIQHHRDEQPLDIQKDDHIDSHHPCGELIETD